MKRWYTLLALVLTTMLLLVGCSKEQSNDGAKEKTVTYKGSSYTVPASPQRISGLSNSIVNMLYAIGGTAISRVESSDLLSPEVEKLPTVGHTATINMEQLVALKPDLVLGLATQHQKFGAQLESNKLPHILISYDGIQDNVPLLQFLGSIINKEDKAKEVVAGYEKDLAKVKEEVKKVQQQLPVQPKVAVLRATGKAVTAETDLAIGASLVQELGMHNVVMDHKGKDVTTKTIPYSLETLAVDDPNVIFVVTMGKREEINETFKKEMSGNPAWANIKAVQNDKVIFLPSNLFLLNPGLETPNALRELAQHVYGVTIP